MRTDVDVIRGPLKGRRGWISGNLEDRARRGVTKAVVHTGEDVELLSIENLAPVDQLELFQTKTPPARSPTAFDELIRTN